MSCVRVSYCCSGHSPDSLTMVTAARCSTLDPQLGAITWLSLYTAAGLLHIGSDVQHWLTTEPDVTAYRPSKSRKGPFDCILTNSPSSNARRPDQHCWPLMSSAHTRFLREAPKHPLDKTGPIHESRIPDHVYVSEPDPCTPQPCMYTATPHPTFLGAAHLALCRARKEARLYFSTTSRPRCPWSVRQHSPPAPTAQGSSRSLAGFSVGPIAGSYIRTFVHTVQESPAVVSGCGLWGEVAD